MRSLDPSRPDCAGPVDRASVDTNYYTPKPAELALRLLEHRASEWARDVWIHNKRLVRLVGPRSHGRELYRSPTAATQMHRALYERHPVSAVQAGHVSGAVGVRNCGS